MLAMMFNFRLCSCCELKRTRYKSNRDVTFKMICWSCLPSEQTTVQDLVALCRERVETFQAPGITIAQRSRTKAASKAL